MEAQSKLETILKAHKLSLTNQRRDLFNVLSGGDTFTMQQLVQRLSDRMDRTSVYRGIDLFEKLGVVNRIQIGWKYKLELSEEFSSHHHHASCLQCGKTTTFEENNQLEAGIHALADELGYRLSGHTLELRGWCAECR